MSVLIKGIETPENCNKCRFQSALRLYCDAMPYNFCGNTDDIERPDWCPLIEVQPHGRLIDADALRVLFADWYRVLDDTMREEVALRYIDDAPTVIEAEGET